MIIQSQQVSLCNLALSPKGFALLRYTRKASNVNKNSLRLNFHFNLRSPRHLYFFMNPFLSNDIKGESLAYL